MTPLSPIGWVVTDPSRASVALFLERPMADQFAVRVHGTVDALYSGAQLALAMSSTFGRRHADAQTTEAPDAPGTTPHGDPHAAA